MMPLSVLLMLVECLFQVCRYRRRGLCQTGERLIIKTIKMNNLLCSHTFLLTLATVFISDNDYIT